MGLVADNLRSIDTFEILLGLTSGTIKGFKVSKEKSIFIDDTPLEAFKDIKATLYNGTAMGTMVPLQLGGQASNNSVGVKLSTGTSVTRRGTSVSPLEVRRIELRLLLTALYIQNEREGLLEGDTTIKVEYKQSSAALWTEVNSYKISGKTTSNYAKEYGFDVPQSAKNYDIRVTKISPAEDSATDRADVFWESFQEIVPSNPTYKNLSMLHVVGRGSNQIRGVPSIWSDLELKKVKIPTGYDPVAKTYSQGIWGGTFKSALAHTTNPIWNLYDVATDAENGVASYYNINLDKFSVYQVARWCDEMVPSSLGGVQPRFTLNLTINEPTGAKELLRYLAGLCASTFFDDGNGNAYIRADISTEPVAMFTPENVLDGEFGYSFTDVNTRHNDITVEFINPSLGWNSDRRRVFSQTSIDALGRIPHDFVAIGCIDEGEALRRARHHLVTAQKEKQFVSFKTNRAGLALNPYDVFLVGDPKVGYAITGRMTSSAGTVLTLRDPVTLEVGHTYKVKFQVPNQNYPSTETSPMTIIERTVTSASPGLPVTVLALSRSLPAEIAENATFAFESDHIFGTPKRFRLLTIEETEGSQDIVQVSAIEVYQNKWAEILGQSYSDINYSVYDPFGNPLPPTGLDLRIDFRVQGTVSKPFLAGAITGNLVPTNRYRVSYRRDGGPRTVFEVDEPDFEIEDIPIGIYSFSIQAVGKTGKVSAPFERNFVVKENLRNPNAPRFIALISDTGSLTEFDLFPTIEWTRGVEDAFVERYIVVIKDTNDVVINTYEVSGDKTSFAYDLEKLNADAPSRTFQICVAAAFTVPDPSTRVDFQQLSVESCITVNNPRPVVAGVFVSPKLVGSEVGALPVRDLDYLRMHVWASTSETFTPSQSTLIYGGAATVYHHVHYEPLWFKVAFLDSYDPSDYTISPAVYGVPKLIGDDADQLAPFAGSIAPVVLVDTIAQRDNFLTYANVNDIPKFVYVTGTDPAVLYEYNATKNMYQSAIQVDLTNLDIDVSQIPSNVMPNREMNSWSYFGTASRVEIDNGPAKYGCLVFQTPGSGETSGCKSPYIPITGGQTYSAGAWIRV